MYLTISFKGISEFEKDVYLFAYTILTYDEYNNHYYVFITDTKPICNYDICSKIPDEFYGKLENYSLIISSKEGDTDSREDIIVHSSNYSPYIEEYENDIIIYMSKNITDKYLLELSKKSIYYYYSFYFNEMELTKNGNFNELKQNKKLNNSPTFEQSSDNLFKIDNLLSQEYY